MLYIPIFLFFFFNDTATTEIYTLSLHDALPIYLPEGNFLILNGRRQPLNFEAWDRMAQNPSHVGHALYCVASEGYFRTVGIPLIRGRIFNARDDFASPNVALISQSLARERWSNEIGRAHV